MDPRLTEGRYAQLNEAESLRCPRAGSPCRRVGLFSSRRLLGAAVPSVRERGA